MADTPITNLSIQISSNADRAVQNINRVSNSLSRLGGSSRNAAQGMGVMNDTMEHAASRTVDASSNIQTFGSRLRSALGHLRTFGTTLANGVVGGFRAGVVGIGRFVGGMARIARYRFIRAFLKDMGQSFKDLYGYSQLFGTEFHKSMDMINTSLVYFRNSIAAMVSPLVNALAPALDFIVDKIVNVLNWFNQLFSALSGSSTYTVAKKFKVSWEDSLSSTSKTAKKTVKEVQRTLLGFDEINRLNMPTSSGSSGGSGSSPYSANYDKMFETKKLSGNWSGFSDAIANSLKTTLSKISAIVSGASLAVGAILTFSGHPTIGIPMMIAGGAGLASTIALNWNGLSKNVKKGIAAIEAVMGTGLLAVGALFAFSGANIPLGIGLMISGAATLGSAVSLTWGTVLTGGIQNVLQNIAETLSVASLAVGAVLAFSGANVPLGIGLMVAGAVGTAASLAWGSALNNGLSGALKETVGIISGAGLAVGAVLAFTGANVPVGIGLMVAGISGVAASMAWGTEINNGIGNVLRNIVAIVSPASLALGAILAFSGANIPVGVGLIAAGVTGTAVSLNWGGINGSVSNSLKNITTTVSLASVAIGAILALTGVAVPLGIGMIAAGVSGTAVSVDWDWLGTKVKGAWEDVKQTTSDIWSALKLGASDMAEWVKTAVSGAWDSVSAWTTSKWTSVKINATKIWVDLKIGAEDMATTVKNAVVGAWSSITTWTSSTWNTVKNAVSNTWDSIVSGVGTAWESIKGKLNDFGSWLQETFSVDWEGAWTTIVTGFGNVFETIKDKIKGPINAVIGFLNKMISKIEYAINKVVRGINGALSINIPAMRTPFGSIGGWSWSPRLSGVTWGRIELLATGGILDAPTMLAPNVMGGEAGREAVLPLENHTEWMDTLAERILATANSRLRGVSGGNTPLDASGSAIDYNQLADTLVTAMKRAGLGAVKLDGRMLAQSINRETQRLGSPAVVF